jgi:hypothetical protein
MLMTFQGGSKGPDVKALSDGSSDKSAAHGATGHGHHGSHGTPTDGVLDPVAA